MDVKTIRTRVEIKDAAKGEFVAIIATMNVKDSDDDVTLPGAFDDGANIVVSAYGHSSWGGFSAAQLPVGDAVIKATDEQAEAHGRFYLDTTAGADTFKTVRNLAEKGLGDWSYGYDALKVSFGDWQGDQVRFLEKLKVFEGSPVLVGAGVGTRTLVAKAMKTAGMTDEQVRKILDVIGSDVSSSETLADSLKSGVDALADAIDGAVRVVALRAERGKPLSGKNRELLKRAQGELSRLVDLVGVDAPADTDDDMARREHMRYIRSLHR
jgi:hypothetical protein